MKKKEGPSALTSVTTTFVVVLVDQSFRRDQPWIGSSETGFGCFAEEERIPVLWEGSPPPTFGLSLARVGPLRHSACDGDVVRVSVGRCRRDCGAKGYPIAYLPLCVRVLIVEYRNGDCVFVCLVVCLFVCMFVCLFVFFVCLLIRRLLV